MFKVNNKDTRTMPGKDKLLDFWINQHFDYLPIGTFFVSTLVEK